MISTNYKKIKSSFINKSKTKIMKKYISFALFIFVMSSCNKYYKVTTAGTGKNAAQTIEQLKNNGRYFILRSGSQAFAMDSLVIDNKEQTLQCVLNILPEEHLVHLTKGTKGKMRYTELNGYEPDVTPILREVHLYQNAGADLNPGPHILAVNQIQKMEIIEKDKKRTASSKVVGTVIGVTVSALTLGLIIFAIGWGSGFGPH